MENTFTVPDDVGMGYESGVRVLQSLGNWSPDIPANVPRPNLIPFIEPYIEGGSMHPASRLKALQQVQQASQNTRKPPKSMRSCDFFNHYFKNKNSIFYSIQFLRQQLPQLIKLLSARFVAKP